MSEPRSFTIRRATSADRPAALALTERAFRARGPDPDADARWRWLFEQNPAGVGFRYLVADAGDRLAGQYAMVPQRMLHEGRAVLGLLSLHTAVDPDFERRGLFTTLASRLYAESADDAPLVYGFPNANSAPGFYQKLGWVSLRPYPVLVRPLGHARDAVRAWRPKLSALALPLDAAAAALGLRDATASLALRAGGARVVPFEAFGPWADELWSRVAPSLGTTVVRDRAYLDWRFVHAPRSYRRLALERGGRVEGFVVTAIAPWRGQPLGFVMELVTGVADHAGASLLLARALSELRAGGAVAAYTLATPRHPARRSLLLAGFVPVHARLAAGHSFGVRINGPGVVPDRALHTEDWHLSPADLDYV